MSAPVLPGVLADLAPLLDHWGYAAVGGLLFLEDFGIPVPGETVLIAAAVYAGAGRLNIVAVGAIALLAAILGDNVGYAIGRFGGHRLVTRFGRYVLLTPARIARTEAFFNRHGAKIITVARFIEVQRQVNGIIAGLSEMPWRRFLAFNVLGAHQHGERRHLSPAAGVGGSSGACTHCGPPAGSGRRPRAATNGMWPTAVTAKSPAASPVCLPPPPLNRP
ncbi:DedA family protein [Streptomyces sp. S186]|uniref:DedA family protein n=1 Tax=Streptomyces sp. S186 TaxID=3434395 RepID=UPI003F661F39